MQKKLLGKMVLVGLMGTLLSCFFAFFLYYHVFSTQVRMDIHHLAQVYANLYEQRDAEHFYVPPSDDNYRLTLVDVDGTVLYDSQAQGQLENHSNRPEIIDAFTTGTGSSERTSETFSVLTFYEAICLSDGRVFRIAADTKSIYAVFTEAIPWLVLCLCILAFAEVFISQELTKKLVKPIIEMGEHLEQVENYVPYPELTPLSDAIVQDRIVRQTQEQFRREFTANVSHELKTPLTSISGYAELMANGMIQNADIPTFSGYIQKEASRMISLVADIIQLSELDNQTADKPIVEFSAVDLSNIVAEIVNSLRFQAQKSFVTLTKESESVNIQGNGTLLEELCENLVENAIRYNRAGGRVTVRSGCRNHRPFLEVSDNGIGIPKSAQGRVFERFYRVDKSRSKATGGTGLGLAIVKHIAAVHHAEIQLESEIGVGTTVTVWFSSTR